MIFPLRIRIRSSSLERFGDLLWNAVKSGKYGIQTHVLVSNTFIRSFMRCFHVASPSTLPLKRYQEQQHVLQIFQTWEYSGVSFSGLVPHHWVSSRLSPADECSFLFDGCHFKFSTCSWAQQLMKEKETTRRWEWWWYDTHPNWLFTRRDEEVVMSLGIGIKCCHSGDSEFLCLLAPLNHPHH